MVAYLSKYDASKGFNQIIDFLNGSSLKYSLTVNPNIYATCIKQFWTTVAVKLVNDVTRLQALVDRKKVVVTEAMIREALHLDDAEGVDYLPNEEIFVELARMGYKKPSTKLTFYKAFFSSQHMLLLLVHTLLLFSLTNLCCSLSAVRSSRQGFCEVETPLFKGMLVKHEIDKEGDAYEYVEEVDTGDAARGDVSAARGEVPAVTEEPSIPSPTPPTPPPQPPQDISLEIIPAVTEEPSIPSPTPPTPPPQPPQDIHSTSQVGTSQRVETSDDTVMDDESNQGRMIAKIDQDDAVVLKDDKEEDKEVADAVKDVEKAKV
nr:hypothetical protein [Tanacetum cinerariifolium]